MRIYAEEKTKTSAPPSHQNGHHHHHPHHFVNAGHSYNSRSSVSPLSSCSSTSSSTSSTFEIQNGQSVNRIPIPLIYNKAKRPNISMFKFINTKGKQATKDSSTNGFGNFRGSSTSNLYFDSSNNHNVTDYAKPPRYVTSNRNFYKKRISAIDKIQEELREMKLREDELRCQRGLSYPNLNSICGDDSATEDFNMSSDDQTIETLSEENKDSFHSRCSSNPDLLGPTQQHHETSSSSNNSSSTLTIQINDGSSSAMSTTSEDMDCGLKIGGPRRKIPLIALWEQKIQEENGTEQQQQYKSEQQEQSCGDDNQKL